MFHKSKLADPNVPGGWIESEAWRSWGRPLNAVRGESHRQTELRKTCGDTKPARGGYTVFVEVTVAREPRNPVDRWALKVTLQGLHVGYMARELAEHLSPGLDKAKCKEFVIPGVVRGGGEQAPSLGVHVWLDRRITPGPAIVVDASLSSRDEFWVPWPPDYGDLVAISPVTPGDDVPGVYTGGTQHGGRWAELDVGDSAQSVKRAREFLTAETHALERHFAFNLLEEHLYKIRDLAPSLLIEFESACEQHHSEMEFIRPALIQLLGGLPFIPMYKQMPITLSKRKEFSRALEWCQRGIDVYGQECLERQWPEDLAQRMAKLGNRMAR